MCVCVYYGKVLCVPSMGENITSIFPLNPDVCVFVYVCEHAEQLALPRSVESTDCYRYFKAIMCDTYTHNTHTLTHNNPHTYKMIKGWQMDTCLHSLVYWCKPMFWKLKPSVKAPQSKHLWKGVCVTHTHTHTL